MSGAPENYSPETILEAPKEAAPILPVQGGGARRVVGYNSTGKPEYANISGVYEATQGEPVKKLAKELNSSTASNMSSESNNSEEEEAESNDESNNESNMYSINTAKREDNTNSVKGVTLIKLEAGFRVRVPNDTIKQEIMDLDFTPDEERLFTEYLKFDNAFAKKYITKNPLHQNEFFEFWKLFVEKDGTNGYTLMTKSEGKKLQNYMEQIIYAQRDYLIQSALRLLRKQDNPETFELITNPPESDDGFIFAEVKPRPLNEGEEEKKNENEDEDENENEEYVPGENGEEDEDKDEEDEGDSDEGDSDEGDSDEEEEDSEAKIKNILTHIHKKIVTVSSSDTPEEKVIKLLEYLTEEFEYTETDKETTISLLGDYLGCKKSPRGKLSCRLDINQDYDKITCKTFLETFNDKFTLSKIAKMSYHDDTEVLKWLIENLYLVSITKTSAEYKEIIKSRLVYFYDHFIRDFVGNMNHLLIFIAAGMTYKNYLTREKLPELPETLKPKKKK